MRGKMFDERRTAHRHAAEGKARHCPDLTRRFKFKPTLERLEDRLAPTASLSLSVSASNPIYGQSVTLSGNLNPPNLANAGDSIQFLNMGVALAQSANLDSSGASYSLSTTTIPAGSYSLLAHDATDTTVADSTAQSLTVAPAKTVTQVEVFDAGTAMPVTSLVFGEFVYFVAFVHNSDATGATPTGTVQFSTDGAPGPTLSLMPNGGDSNVAVAQTGIAPVTDVGVTHIFSAHYTNSDGDFVPPASDAAVQITSIPASTTTSNVTSSPNPSVFGQPVTLTAGVGVVGPGGGPPLGTLTFMEGTTTLGTGVLTEVDMGSIRGGVATFSTSSLSVGNDTITASYGGSAFFNASDDKSSSTPLVQTVNKLASSTLLGSALSPSVFGQPAVFFTFVVAGVASPTPTGSVTFKEGATTLAANVSLSGGHAAFSTSSLPPGSHTITAAYNGDGTFLPSSSATTQVVNQDGTTTALSSSADPSVFGQVVSFTATVNPLAPGNGTPTGTVDFKEGVIDLTPGGVTLSGGRARFTASALSVGHHTIAASYSGDANFTSSHGDNSAAPQVVNQASTRTVLTAFPDPAVFGQAVSFTVNVSALSHGKGTPTGTVTFTDGTTTIGSLPLSAGRATFTTAALSRGAHGINVNYGGDSNFLASAYHGFGAIVQKDATTTTVAASVNPAIVGQTITFTGAVQANAPGSGSPTGTVTFMDITTVLGTATLSVGKATFTTSALAVATHAITASYAGDNNFTSSFSMNLAETVKISAKITAISAAPNHSVSAMMTGLTPREVARVARTAPASSLEPTRVDHFFGAVSVSRRKSRPSQDEWLAPGP
jgi:predicted pyridoxine 5'-phosphate oxidase superfamily flavin-nucleotide-binding protein